MVSAHPAGDAEYPIRRTAFSVSRAGTVEQALRANYSLGCGKLVVEPDGEVVFQIETPEGDVVPAALDEAAVMARDVGRQLQSQLAEAS